MFSKEEKEIYQRQICLDEIGEVGQLKLKRSKVLVVGAGGLGCPVLQYLSAAGVGTIGIADFDQIDASNLHRQVLFSYSSLGKSKALEAKKRLLENNPFIDIETIIEGITIGNAEEVISRFDLVVDCTDNYNTRYLINDSCVLLNKPLVYGAIYKFEGQVSVFNYNKGPSYRCLYNEPPAEKSIANCATTGVIGVLPGIIGSLQANEALKLILEIGKPLSGKLLQYNAQTNQFDHFLVKRKPHPIYDRLLEEKKLDPKRYNSLPNCRIEVHEIDWNQFEHLLDEKPQLIDVRELDEAPQLKIGNVLNIPLGQLENRISEIDREKQTIVFCQSGKRSKKAIQFLQEKYEFNNLSNLRNGISVATSLNEIILNH